MVSRFAQPPYPTGDLHSWALQMVEYLQRGGPISDENPPAPIFLQHQQGDERANQDGVLMFDRVAVTPVYSGNGVWRKMVSMDAGGEISAPALIGITPGGAVDDNVANLSVAGDNLGPSPTRRADFAVFRHGFTSNYIGLDGGDANSVYVYANTEPQGGKHFVFDNNTGVGVTRDYYFRLNGAEIVSFLGTGAIRFPNRTAASATDLTKHIDLYGGTYGFCITGGTLNYVVPSSSNHFFRVGTASPFVVQSSFTRNYANQMVEEVTLPYNGGSATVAPTVNGAGSRMSANTTGAYMTIQNPTAATGTSQNYRHYFGLTQTVGIRVDGNVLNANNSYGALSDISLKENVIDANPQLADLLALRVVNFNLIGHETKQLGLIAQEVQQVKPGLVELEEDGLLSIKYSVLVPILVKAVQELAAQVEELKNG